MKRLGRHMYMYTSRTYFYIAVVGVGDLYTDPQIHTSDGEGYGEANLGPRGMALFFNSHKCNR